MYKIDLNCDLGESYGAYTIGMDEQVIPHISSANVACGFHASDPVTMERTVKLCRENAVAVGAHPGLPDLLGFGRRNMKISCEEARTYVQYQVGALWAFCRAAGVPMQHVKPHGALYNMAGRDYALARAICEGVRDVDGQLIMLVLSGSELERAARDTGLAVAREVFADRGYEEDGSLVPRGRDGAMITDEDEAVKRVLSMVKRGCVRSVTGREIAVQADSVCVHGDGPQALAFVQRLRKALEDERVEICNLKTVSHHS